MAKDEKTELGSLRIFRYVLFGILILLTLFAFIVLVTPPEMNFRFTLLPGVVIIGSLTLAAILVREMIEHAKLRKEVNYAQSLYAEVLRAIKADERTRTIPVVMVTSSQQDPDIKTAYEFGAHSYVVKPLNFDVFVEAMSKLGLYWLLVNQVPKL